MGARLVLWPGVFRLQFGPGMPITVYHMANVTFDLDRTTQCVDTQFCPVAVWGVLLLFVLST